MALGTDIESDKAFDIESTFIISRANLEYHWEINADILTQTETSIHTKL